jgi:hypothetical protein
MQTLRAAAGWVMIVTVMCLGLFALASAASYVLDEDSYPTHRLCVRCDKWTAVESSDAFAWCHSCGAWIYLPGLRMSNDPMGETKGP